MPGEDSHLSGCVRLEAHHGGGRRPPGHAQQPPPTLCPFASSAIGFVVASTTSSLPPLTPDPNSYSILRLTPGQWRDRNRRTLSCNIRGRELRCASITRRDPSHPAVADRRAQSWPGVVW